MEIKSPSMDSFNKTLGYVPETTKISLQEAIRKGTLTLFSESVIQTPVKTGRLQSGHRYSIEVLRGRIYPTVKYAIFVHEPTRPHIIEPRRAKVLRFIIGGKVIFAKKVKHPGTKGQPFFEKAIRIRAPEVAKYLWDAGARLITQLKEG